MKKHPFIPETLKHLFRGYLKTLVIAVAITWTNSSFAQQWLDKKYSYDSTLNVIYGTAINFNGGIDTLKMDIYSPICNDASEQSRKPLLMWIHGGAFLAGSKEDQSITKLCKEFAKRGYITTSISYRLGFVADDTARNCNFPNYSCVHATDNAEWYRAYYRGVQDGKGALRYLVNRNTQYRLDTNNIFVAGESAGAFIAMGIALMDTAIERPLQTFQIGAVPRPSSNTNGCGYNQGKSFTSATISRPDLGGIDGTVEPTNVKYTIKGVGNMYGAMMSDLLQHSKSNTAKPAIYSFHQPCDLIVPIDSGKVYQGLNWCLTNGYNCYAVRNSPAVYGSRAIRDWNTAGNYGYTIQNEFTSTNFPFNFLFGPGSCADQVNNPCHANDNQNLRENNLAKFFAPLITTNPICDTATGLSVACQNLENSWSVYPNPVTHKLTISLADGDVTSLVLWNSQGKKLLQKEIKREHTLELDFSEYPEGVYLLVAIGFKGEQSTVKVIKQ